MPKYRIKNPVAYHGRRERGDVIEAPEGTFGDDAELVHDVEPPEEESEDSEPKKVNADEISEGMLKDELVEQAEIRDLSTAGTKTELVERIKLSEE